MITPNCYKGYNPYFFFYFKYVFCLLVHRPSIILPVCGFVQKRNIKNAADQQTDYMPSASASLCIRTKISLISVGRISPTLISMQIVLKCRLLKKEESKP